MKSELRQILENSSMGAKETEAIYTELLNLFNVSNSLPNLTQINEKAKHYTDVECNLQNFEDEETIIIERMRYEHGYIQAIKDFVSGDLAMITNGSNKNSSRFTAQI